MKKLRIYSRPAVAYFAPTAGRRFLTLKGAAEAEARARVYRMFPPDPWEDETGAGFNIKYDEPVKYAMLMKRLVRAIMNQYRKSRTSK